MCNNDVLESITDPTNPVRTDDWGAGKDGGLPFGFACADLCRGHFPAVFAHSASPSADGTTAYVAYWVAQFTVLALSRARELAADHWSCENTGDGDALSSALVKIAYGMGEVRAQERAEAERLLATKDKEARKQAGLEGSDRISLELGGDDELLDAAREHESYIAGETLATSVGYAADGAGEKATIEGRELRIAVSKA